MMDKFKVFIALISCKKNIKKAQACKETWLSNLPSNYEFRIFTADENSNETVDDGTNVILGNVHDDYEHLPEKVINAFDYINKNFEYDYIAKIDDDVYFNPVALDNEDFDGYDYIGKFMKTEQSIIEFATGPSYFISKKLCNILTSAEVLESFPVNGYEDVEIAIATLMESPELYWKYNNIAHKYKRDIGFYYTDTFLNCKNKYAIYFLTSWREYTKNYSDEIILYMHSIFQKNPTYSKMYYIFDTNKSENRIKLIQYDTNDIHASDMSFTGKILNKTKDFIEIHIDKIYNPNILSDIGTIKFVRNGDSNTYEYESIELFEYDLNFNLENLPIGESKTKMNNSGYNYSAVSKLYTKFLSGWKDTIYYYSGGIVTDRYLNEAQNKIVYYNKNVFYIDFQNGALEKFIYEPSSNLVYNVPFGKFKNSVDFNYSSCKTVCYFVNDINMPLTKESNIYINDILLASINSCLAYGFNVKLYTFQTICDADRFDNDKIKIIDASTITDIKYDLVTPDNYEVFKQLFKFLIIYSNNEELIMADDNIFFNNEKAIYGFDQSFAYIHLDKINDASIRLHIDTIAAVIKNFFVNELFDKLSNNEYINNIITLLMKPLGEITKNNTMIENYLPKLNNNLSTSYILEIDRTCNDSYINSIINEIPVMILDKQLLTDNTALNINYKSNIGRHFI